MIKILKEIAKINQKSLEDVVFIELKETANLSFDPQLLGANVPLPVFLVDLGEHIRDNIEEIPAIAIIKGIVIVLGCDPEFKYNDNYIRFLTALDDKIILNILSDGLKYAEKEAYLEAIKYFSAVLRIDPNNIDALFNTGRALSDYDQLNETDRYESLAGACFEAAVKKDNQNAYALYHLGFYRYNNGDYQGAQMVWKTALTLALPLEMKEEMIQALTKVEDKARFEEGSKLIMSGRTDEGLELLLTIEPDHSDWWELNFFIGVGYRLKQDFEKAIGYFIKVLNLNSGHIQTMNELGICFLSIGDYEEAEKYYKEAMRISPQNPEIICNMGIVHLNRGDLEEARDHFELAHELAPDDEVIQMWINHINGNEREQ